MKKELSIIDYAYTILKKAGEPMHYRNLTTLIMKKKKILGKTPWKTVNARLCTNSKFKRIGKGRSGIYALSEWE